MEIINITRPGQNPIDGDWVEYHYDNGAIERKTYFESVITPIADKERYISGLDYLRRFSQGQRIAIRELAKTDLIAADLMHLLDATIQQNGQVNLLDPDTVQGVGYLAMKLPAAAIDPAVILA